MIIGAGTDIVEKKRIEKVYLKYGDKFLKKILSSNEVEELEAKPTWQKKISYISNNFAGKESVSKALKTGFSSGLSFNLIEILRDKQGAPMVNLLGKFSELEHRINISLSDINNLSLGFAVIEK